MITVTTTDNELKKFEGVYHNHCEVVLDIEAAGFGWCLRLDGIYVDDCHFENGELIMNDLGKLSYIGTEIWEW